MRLSFLLDYMKQTTFEAQAFLEAVQFFRQEKGHYGAWEVITGDEVQVLWGSELWFLSTCVVVVRTIQRTVHRKLHE